ncbi:MAG TPA: pilus assembly protein PilP, partial [Vicinamibacteria bacterium]|nr:pilus assembly protein PilP [Vicinamibacteria bacterium]
MRATLALISLMLAATMAAAQAPAPVASPSPVSPDVVTNRIDQEIAPAPGSYAYTAQGRRDPFVSLLKPVSESGPGKRRPGMEGFLIQEVALKGIVKDAKGFTAMLVGTDGKSYFVKVGQRLFDGVITAIDASTVTFRQEVTDPL